MRVRNCSGQACTASNKDGSGSAKRWTVILGFSAILPKSLLRRVPTLIGNPLRSPEPEPASCGRETPGCCARLLFLDFLKKAIRYVTIHLLLPKFSNQRFCLMHNNHPEIRHMVSHKYIPHASAPGYPLRPENGVVRVAVGYSFCLCVPELYVFI